LILLLLLLLLLIIIIIYRTKGLYAGRKALIYARSAFLIRTDIK
jgi:hypothetical protein